MVASEEDVRSAEVPRRQMLQSYRCINLTSPPLLFEAYLLFYQLVDADAESRIQPDVLRSHSRSRPPGRISASVSLDPSTDASSLRLESSGMNAALLKLSLSAIKKNRETGPKTATNRPQSERSAYSGQIKRRRSIEGESVVGVTPSRRSPRGNAKDKISRGRASSTSIDKPMASIKTSKRQPKRAKVKQQESGDLEPPRRRTRRPT